MPLLGWLAGRAFVNIIGGYDHWVAFALLTVVGCRAIWESFHPEKEEKKTDFTKGWMLLTLSFATSVDAFAVGLSFAFLKVNIVTAGLLIGITTFLVSILGFALGRKIGDYAGKRAELVGGLILIAIGLQILLTHLL
jgi:putative Mn2+ efflux pump MntP